MNKTKGSDNGSKSGIYSHSGVARKAVLEVNLHSFCGKCDIIFNEYYKTCTSFILFSTLRLLFRCF